MTMTAGKICLSRTFPISPTRLYRSLGHGRFEDVSMAAGVALPHMHYLSFGCEFFDYDADGWKDLIIADGHLQLHVADNFDNVSDSEPKQLMHNEGGRFAEVTAGLGDLAQPTGEPRPRRRRCGQ